MPLEVGVPVPLIGDPVLFPSEPYIVVSSGRHVLRQDAPLQVPPRMMHLLENVLPAKYTLTAGADFDVALPYQSQAMWLAVALKLAHGPGRPSSYFARDLKPILGRDWVRVFPLAYASYRGMCVAGKGSEDPVVIYRRSFGAIHLKQANMNVGRSGSAEYVEDVIDHAVGRLSVKCAQALRKRDRRTLAAGLNAFMSLLCAKSADLLFAVSVCKELERLAKEGAAGCAYIPTWEALIWL
jgi:hypothetical protein